MKAVVFNKYGPPDVLELVDIETPAPKDDEVLVRVHAVSLNDWDWEALRGTFINRPMFGWLAPKKKILGSDIAGRVEAVGAKVVRFRVGDEVFGDLSGTWGGLAEYVCARESALALKPAGMSFVQAAAIPQAAMLAVQGLRDVGKLQAGQTVLINGAGGGVGTFGIQLAKLYGAEVTGVDRGEKLELMRELGADHVIDYTREDCTRSARQYDLILDVKAQRSLFDWSRVLKRNGSYVALGGSMSRVFRAFLLLPWFSIVQRKRFALVVLKVNKDLEYVKELFDAGKLVPVIDGPYPLSDTAKLFRYFGEGRHKGKVVIIVA